MTAALRSLADRATSSATVRAAVSKAFPGHWSFLLGEIALYSFMVLVSTGIFLLFFFDASGEDVIYTGSYEPLQGVEMSKAYASALDLSFDVGGGLLMRQVHHWAAVVFTGAIALHAFRVFFTGAFRRPRRLNWTVGVTMLGLALVNGFFGLSLPDDLLSGTGARVGYTFALSVPVIGPELAFAIFGGEFPGDEMIPRLYWLHILVVPGLIGLLLGAHLTAVYRQTHTQFPGGRRREGNVVGDRAWPVYLAKSTSLLLFVVGVLFLLGGAAQINPVWQYGPYRPAAATVPAQPDAYLQWVEGALRISPPLRIDGAGFVIPSPFLTGVSVPVAIFALLYLWPFLEERVTGDRRSHHLLDRPRDRPVRTAIGVWGVSLLGVLTAAASHDLQALWLDVPLDTVTWFYRGTALVLPPIAASVAWRTCHALQASERIEARTPRT